jgi:DNA uptake protein ComE-like DNA-binding protein
VGRVAKASVEELAEVEGVGEKVAATIAAYFVKA